MGPRKRDGNKTEEKAAKLLREFTLISGERTEHADADCPPFDPATASRADEIAGAATQAEARQLAQEAVWLNARKLVADLVEKPGGQYLAIRFLFEFAGLMTAEEQKESKADFKAFMQDLLNRPKTGLPKQTSAAKVNLSTSGDTDRGRS